MQQEYAYMEVYNNSNYGSPLKKTQSNQEFSVISLNLNYKEESGFDIINSDLSNPQIPSKTVMAGTDLTSLDLLDLKKTLCKQIDDSLLVFRRKLNQNLEKKFDVLEAKMADIQNEIEDLKTFISEKNTTFQTSDKNVQRINASPYSEPPSVQNVSSDIKIFTLNQIEESYDCSFPLKTIEDFKEFDKKISHDLYDELRFHLISSINTDKSLKVICSSMFKKLFSRGVLTSTTAQKKNNVKLLFKETNFFSCLKDAMRIAFFRIDVIEEKALLKAIGAVINNSVDWDGHRVKRQKIVEHS